MSEIEIKNVSKKYETNFKKILSEDRKAILNGGETSTETAFEKIKE